MMRISRFFLAVSKHESCLSLQLCVSRAYSPWRGCSGVVSKENDDLAAREK